MSRKSMLIFQTYLSELTVKHALKHEAGQKVESEVFSMSIKHPKGRRMGVFHWFIGDGLILTLCRVPTSLIRRV